MPVVGRLPQISLLAGSALSLSGCIAAAALPIVAGSGALVRNSISGDAVSANRAPEGLVSIRDRARATPTPSAPAPAPSPAPPPAELAPVDVSPEPVASAPMASTPPLAADTSTEALAPAEPPVVQTATAPVEPLAEETTASGYALLRSYALRALGGGLPLPSAQLADPTSLQPVRRVCEGSSPTIVFDLDPAGGLVPLVGPLAVNDDLARVLADLRSRGVNVAWLTDRTPIDARAVRDRLVAANLDPDAEDAIYVERYPGETKQARRDAIAQTSCVIAMVGDTRADFDDLYSYIIDEGDARALEPMLGNGWFLIENPVGE